MSEHRYSRRVLYAACARALLGIGAAVLFSIVVENGVVSWAFVAASVGFFTYGISAVGRAMEIVTLSADGFNVRGWRHKSLPFSEMTDLKLAYFTTRRDGEKGWMQLVVKGRGEKIVVESEIGGFSQIAAICHAQASKIGLELSVASGRNFSVLLGDDMTAGQKHTYGLAGTAR